MSKANEKAETDDTFSAQEATRRRDEVVRRMANTPPQPRKAKNPPRQGKKTSTGAGQKKGRDRGKS